MKPSKNICFRCARTATIRPSFRLEKLLAEARAAERMPWEPSQLSLYRLIFPQMTLWLAKDEGTQYRTAFDRELKRLEGPDENEPA